MKRITLFLNILLCLFASIYLTFLVDVYTLNSVLARVFVVCLFLLLCLAILFLKQKFLLAKPLSWHGVVVVGLLATGIVGLGHNVFLPGVQETTVSLSAVASEDGAYHEVWLTAAAVDGQEISLSQLNLNSMQGWIYIEEYDDYVFYPSAEGNHANNLRLLTPTGELTLTFAQNAWSGSVQINTNETDQTMLPLTSNEGVDGSVTHTLEIPRTYGLGQSLLYGGGAMVILAFLLLPGLAWLEGRGQGKSAQRQRKMVMVALFLLNALFLFFTCDRIQPTPITRLALLLLTLAATVCFVTGGTGDFMQKYRTRSGWLSIGLISVYASLASFAQRFFLDGNTRIHGSFSGMTYCISGVLFFLPVIWLLLFCLEWLSARNSNKNRTISRRKAWWTLFGVLAICQLVVLWILWPGGFPPDAIDQLNQATGTYAMNDWHPLLHTLLEKAILSIIPIPGVLTAVQMLFFTWLLTAFLMIGYDQGISIGLLCALGCVFELLPNQALSWSNALKDFPFTLALLWGAYLLLQLALDSACSQKWPFYLCLALDLFLILGLRHNGIVPFVAVALLCLILTVRYFRQIQIKAVLAVCLAVVSFAVYKGPVFKALNVAPNNMSPYTTMFCAVASCVNKGLPLSEESERIMETAIPLQDWGDYYSRYYGHDPYFWGRPEGSVPYDTSRITTKDAFTIYFEALSKYPDVVIKDRLDGMDLMWDVVQPPDSFNGKSFDFVSTFDMDVLYFNTDNMDKYNDGSFHKTTFLARAYYATESFPINGLPNILVWRTGAYLIAFLVLLLFWWKNHMGRFFWAAVPMLGNVAASALVLYHQSFRYVYFIQITVVALLFCSVCLRNSYQKRWET